MKLDIKKLETGRILNYAIDPYNAHKLLKRELKENDSLIKRSN